MADPPAPLSAADAFREASPSGGVDFNLSEDAQARALAQHEADAKGPVSPAPPKPILSTTYPGGPGAPGVPWSSPEYPGDPGDTPRRVAGAITGDTSVAHPEIGALNMPGLGLGVFDPKAWGIVGNMATSRDPVALERAIQSRIPEAKFTGEGAERMVQVPGQPPMYLDRPGMTPQKGLFYGPQTLAAVASGGRSLPAQMALGGTQHALSTAISNLLDGATSPIDPLGTAISTLMPGALGAAGAGLIKGYDWLNSEVVPPAADTIKRLGVEGMDAVTQAATNVADRARKLYQFGFAGKPGDLTADPALLAKEDIVTNAGSDAAKRIMADFHQKNAQTALLQKRQIIGETAGDVAPGTKVPDDYFPNEATFGNRVNDAVTARVKALTNTERDAWDKIGDLSPSTEAGRSVSFSPDVSADVLGNHARIMNKYFGEPQGPNGTWSPLQLGDTGKLAADAFSQTKRVMQAVEDGEPGALQTFNLGHLQDLRQQFGNIMRDKPGTAAAAAAAEMKRTLDAAVTTAENTPGAMTGTRSALDDFRAANAATRARYQFTEPENNPSAERFIASVTNPAAPSTGQETISSILGGGGTVTPGGGTNAILTHLQAHLGDDATRPLAGATTMRSLYGTKGTTEEGGAAPARYDYDSTANRIHSQIAGTGDDVAATLLTPEARARLGDFRDALNILGASNRKGGPRLNAPGSGYISMMTRELPLGLGPFVDKVTSTQAAKGAVQGGAEIVNKAVGGAATPAGLGIRLPRQSTIQGPDPQNPFYSWQPGAWRAGTPIYRGGGLLGAEALDPANRQ